MNKDYIFPTIWAEIADFSFDGDFCGMPDEGVLYCPAHRIPDFFNEIECESKDRNYVLLTFAGDDSLTYNNEIPDFVRRQLRCNSNDKYAFRDHGNVYRTFNDIPKCIKKWFCTNVAVNHPKIECVPLGIQNGTEDLIKYNRDKKDTLYINFTAHYFERKILKEIYRDYPYCTFKENISHKEYFEDLSNHKFCLCPPGNGIDSFRIWEAIYNGCIPIVNKTIFTNYFSDMPIIQIRDLTTLNVDLLDLLYDDIINKPITRSKTKYWKNMICKTAPNSHVL